MEDQLGFLAYMVHERRLILERHKRIGASQEAEEDARNAYQQAIAKLEEAASMLGVSFNDSLLAECEQYVRAQKYISELFPYLPTARLYKKFLDYDKRWHFAEKEPDKRYNFEKECILLNDMTQEQLEEFLESDPDPDLAMHALGLMANHALKWSQTVLLEFLLLAERVRQAEQEMISRENAAGMIQAVIFQMDKKFGER